MIPPAGFSAVRKLVSAPILEAAALEIKNNRRVFGIYSQDDWRMSSQEHVNGGSNDRIGAKPMLYGR